MNRHLNFIFKMISMLLIVIVLWQYQNLAEVRAQEVAEREAEIAEVIARNEEILNQETESNYTDGTYEGTGIGFGGEIVVSVTVSDGKIDSIEITGAEQEDPAYYEQAVDVVDEMLKQQDTQVDTVSGATYSSQGIIDATADALGKAVK